MIDGDELRDASNGKTEDAAAATAAAVLKVRPKILSLLPLEGAHDPARDLIRARRKQNV